MIPFTSITTTTTTSTTTTTTTRFDQRRSPQKSQLLNSTSIASRIPNFSQTGKQSWKSVDWKVVTPAGTARLSPHRFSRNSQTLGTFLWTLSVVCFPARIKEKKCEKMFVYALKLTMLFAAPPFTKLLISGCHCMEIYTEFHPHLLMNVKVARINLFTSISKAWRSVSIFMKLGCARQLSVTNSSGRHQIRQSVQTKLLRKRRRTTDCGLHVRRSKFVITTWQCVLLTSASAHTKEHEVFHLVRAFPPIDTSRTATAVA